MIAIKEFSTNREKVIKIVKVENFLQDKKQKMKTYQLPLIINHWKTSYPVLDKNFQSCSSKINFSTQKKKEKGSKLSILKFYYQIILKTMMKQATMKRRRQKP